ncbi:MAG: hydroxyethylthiazole kinase [Streptosporangiales bacterium]
MTRSQPYPYAEVAATIAELRDRTPLVHCLTNRVVINFTANALLAAGASPAMVEDPEEAAEFAPLANALLVNVGTLSRTQADAMRAAVAAATAAGTPWVLDPVAVGGLTFRTQVATELLGSRPTVLRGNASEVLALAGAEAHGKGVDSAADSAAAVDAAGTLADKHGCVVAVSGEVDYVTDGQAVYHVPGGHPMMTKVTGMGCVLGALIAACTAVTEPLRAAVTGSTLLAVAGERAASEGLPGSLAVALLDELYEFVFHEGDAS